MTGFVGNMFLERGDTGSPVSYTRICEIFGISGLGQTNSLVDVTTFCSGGNREYVGGLADGTEVTLEANFSTTSNEIKAMIQDVKDKAVRDFRVVVDENGDGNADQAFYFSGTCLSWTLNPSVDNRNTISFTIKISGDILVV